MNSFEKVLDELKNLSNEELSAVIGTSMILLYEGVSGKWCGPNALIVGTIDYNNATIHIVDSVNSTRGMNDSDNMYTISESDFNV